MNFLICCMNDVYALDGKLISKQTNSLNGLKGIYVINGKTVIIK